MADTFGRLDPADHDVMLEHPLSTAQLREMRDASGARHIGIDHATAEVLIMLHVVRVAPVDRPEVGFGEQAVIGAEQWAPGQWRQTWTVEATMTLGAAKLQLAQMVCDIYWQRMQAVPTPQELDGPGSFIGVLQARQTRFATPLAEAKTEIQGAVTIAEAYTIYQQLEAVP